MRNRREHLIRGAFSFLAATVTLGMSQEHFVWALERRQWWGIGVAYVLASFAMFEAHSVWRHGEWLLGLTDGPD